MTNVFLKKIFQASEEIIIKLNDSSRANFERADQIITWIVGFSIGIFVFILSKDEIENLKNISGTRHIVLNFSLYVIIFGLLYRVISFITSYLNTMILNDILSFSKGFTMNLDDLPISRTLTGNETNSELAKYLLEDFSYTVSIKIKDDDSKLNELLVNYYNSLSYSNNIDKQMDEYKSYMSKYLGISKKYMDILSKEKNIKIRGKIYRWFTFISIVLFITTITIFIIGVIKLLLELNNY